MKTIPPASIDTTTSLMPYLFLNSELELGRLKEFNNRGMEVQVKRALSAIFCHQKSKKQKSKQTLHDIFFNPPITTLNPLIFQSSP